MAVVPEVLWIRRRHDKVRAWDYMFMGKSEALLIHFMRVQWSDRPVWAAQHNKTGEFMQVDEGLIRVLLRSVKQVFRSDCMPVLRTEGKLIQKITVEG